MTTWLAQNPELLETALEIVDTWDVGYLSSGHEDECWASTSCDSGTDDVASTTSGSAVSSPLPASGSAMMAPRLPKLVVKPSKVVPSQAVARRRLQPSTLTSTHHRRRNEISALTSKAAELEHQLRSLERATRGTSAGIKPGNANAVGRARASEWRDVALREQQLRGAAEAARAKLRRRVQAQETVARDMIKLVQKARRLEEDEVMRSIKRQRFVPRQVFHLEEADQLMRINDTYTNLDRLHRHPKFDDGTMKFIDIQIHEGRSHQFVIEVAEAWTVPFDEDRVMDALWKYSIKRHAEGLCAPEFVMDSEMQVQEDELFAHFTAVAKIGSAQGNFDGRAVVKRFPRKEQSPPTIITTMYSTPNQTTPGDFDGVGNQGLSSIQVLPVATGRSGQSISRVTYSERFTITFEEDAQSRAHASLISHMTTAKLRNSMDIMHGIVETLLLTPSAL